MINDIKPPKGHGAEAVLAPTAQSQQKTENVKFVEAQSVAKTEETFFSPVVKIDAQTQAAILVFRDTKTGEVTQEYPNKAKVGAYEASQKSSSPPVEEKSTDA